MPLSIVSRVGFDANIAHTKGDPKRPTAKPRPVKPADQPPVAGEVVQAEESGGGEDTRDSAASTAGLSILAQALAAYSEN